MIEIVTTPSLFGDAMPSLMAGRVLVGNHVAEHLHLRAGPPGETCRTCGRRYVKEWNRKFHKCQLWDSNSAASDCRLKWPACEHWKPTGEADEHVTW
jgi:hypothetical protein